MYLSMSLDGIYDTRRGPGAGETKLAIAQGHDRPHTAPAAYQIGVIRAVREVDTVTGP